MNVAITFHTGAAKPSQYDACSQKVIDALSKNNLEKINKAPKNAHYIGLELHSNNQTVLARLPYLLTAIKVQYLSIHCYDENRDYDENREWVLPFVRALAHAGTLRCVEILLQNHQHNTGIAEAVTQALQGNGVAPDLKITQRDPNYTYSSILKLTPSLQNRASLLPESPDTYFPALAPGAKRHEYLFSNFYYSKNVQVRPLTTRDFHIWLTGVINNGTTEDTHPKKIAIIGLIEDEDFPLTQNGEPEKMDDTNARINALSSKKSRLQRRLDKIRMQIAAADCTLERLECKQRMSKEENYLFTPSPI